MDLCADDEDPSQLIIRPGWDTPHVRCFPRTFCAWPCLLRQVGTVLGSPYDYVVAGLAYANPGSRHCVDQAFETMPITMMVFLIQIPSYATSRVAMFHVYVVEIPLCAFSLKTIFNILFCYLAIDRLKILQIIMKLSFIYL